jgi:protein gp37
MAENSKIEWTDATWNPIVGCSIVSPGCTNCYAMSMAARIDKMTLSSHYEGLTKKVNGRVVWTDKLALAPDHIMLAPLSWRKPRRVFVNSMGDLFHEDAPDEWIDKAFAVMALAGRHTFQVLTKRPERMQAAVARIGKSIDIIERHARALGHTLKFEGIGLVPWPLPNVWLGVSAERQTEFDERWPFLRKIPAAVTFISMEPLLSPIFFRPAKPDWIIVGGESGSRARDMQPDWARDIRDQCAAAGVPFFMKQMTGKKPIPEDLMVREFPPAAVS